MEGSRVKIRFSLPRFLLLSYSSLEDRNSSMEYHRSRPASYQQPSPHLHPILSLIHFLARPAQWKRVIPSRVAPNRRIQVRMDTNLDITTSPPSQVTPGTAVYASAT